MWLTGRHCGRSQESIAEFPLEMAEFRNVLQKALNPIPTPSTLFLPPPPAAAPSLPCLRPPRRVAHCHSAGTQSAGLGSQSVRASVIDRPKRFVAQSTVGARTYGCAAIPPNTVTGRWRTSVLERG